MSSPTPSAWITRGYEARREQRLDEARECFSRALSFGRVADDKLPAAEAHAGLGQVERDRMNIGASLKHYQIAVELYRKLDAPLRLAHVLRHVADILLDAGDLKQAQRNYEEALAIYRSCEKTRPLDLANTLRGYALLTGELGSAEDATILWQQALSIYEELGIADGVAEARSQVAFLMGR